jgi:trafficking protein particle complex subunit 2
LAYGSSAACCGHTWLTDLDLHACVYEHVHRAVMAAVACVAVIGAANNPLFLRTYTSGEDDTALATLVHASLDAVEERVLLRRGPGEAAEFYLGLLLPTEAHRVYGYVTNTHAKFMVVLRGPAPLREEPVAAALSRLHAAYVDAVSNPFYTAGAPLASPRFESAAAAAVAAYAQMAAAS